MSKLIGIHKDTDEKIELKDYMYNMETKEFVKDPNKEFTHYFYYNPEDHCGYKIIHKCWIKEILKND